MFQHLGLQLSGKVGTDLAVLPKRIICSTWLPRLVWRTASGSTTIHQAWAKSSRELAKLPSSLGTSTFTKSLAAYSSLLLSAKMGCRYLYSIGAICLKIWPECSVSMQWLSKTLVLVNTFSQVQIFSSLLAMFKVSICCPSQFTVENMWQWSPMCEHLFPLLHSSVRGMKEIRPGLQGGAAAALPPAQPHLSQLATPSDGLRKSWARCFGKASAPTSLIQNKVYKSKLWHRVGILTQTTSGN